MPFRNAQPFYPEDLTISRHGQGPTTLLVNGDLQICKQILKFRFLHHARWLKTVARSPGPQNAASSDKIGIEIFNARLRWAPGIHLLPTELDVAKLTLARVLKINRLLSLEKPRRRRFGPPQQSGRGT